MPEDITAKDGKPLLSWRVALLPYLDQQFLYDQFKHDEPWDSPHNRKFLKYIPRVYANAAGQSGTFVKAFAGPGTAFEAGKQVSIPAGFPDGTSNTILCVEAGPAVPWTKPEDLTYDPKKPLPAMDGPYTDRLFATFADGAVHQLRWNLDEATYRRLIERADGQVIGGDWDAPPAKPATEEEKKEAARLRAFMVRDREQIRWATTERAKLLEELDKLGGTATATATELPEDAGIEAIQRERERLHRQARVLWDDVDRLREAVEKRRKAKK
jgi:hypothetical protein